MSYSLRSRQPIDYKSMNEGKEISVKAIDSDTGNDSDVDGEQDQEWEALMEELAEEEKRREELLKNKKSAQRTREKMQLKEKIANLKAQNAKLAEADSEGLKISPKQLHSFEALAKDVEKKLDKMGLSDRPKQGEGDSSTSSDSSSSEEEFKRSTKRGKDDKKSGKAKKIASRVVSPQIWPHSELTLGYVSKEVKYDDLTIEEFVAGYSAILSLPSLSSREIRERISHLNVLMYLATIYEWSDVRCFHAAVLSEIERGRIRWGDSFAAIEARSFAGCTRKLNSTKGDGTKRQPTLFCRDFNKGNCSHGSKDHYATLRGEKKWLSHICAACWVKDRTKKAHAESSSDCPNKKQGD